MLLLFFNGEAVLLLGGLGPLGIMDSAGGVRGCGRTWGFCVGYRSVGEVLLLFLGSFLLVLKSFLFLRGRRALGSHSVGSGHSPNVS